MIARVQPDVAAIPHSVARFQLEPDVFDCVIHGGQVIDGTGAPRRLADVGIQGDRITAVGDLAAAQAARRIDAAGRIVAPGFIDVHNHTDGWLLKVPHLTSKTRQGFTTEVIMSDGISYAPVSPLNYHDWLYYLRSLDGLRIDEYEGWHSIADYMECVRGRNVQNSLPQVPYANVRSLVNGFGPGAMDDFQKRSIRREVEIGMEAGCSGISTGLDYIVQCYSTTDELVDACTAMAPHDGIYVTHVRYKSGLLPALEEAAEIGRRAGVKVHISHLKAQSPAQIDEVLEFLDRTRKDVDITFDVYPYQPGSTMLSYLLPYQIWEDGPLAALARMRDPAIRELFVSGLKAYRLNLDQMHIAWVCGRENQRHQGKQLSEYVAETGQSPEDALFDLLIEERLAVLLVFHEGDDRLVEPFLQHDLYMMGTDGIYFPDSAVHPRQYGSSGRLLGPCVRNSRLFSLEQAVHRMTGFPAERFGLAGRGTIAENSFADVAIFNPETVQDHATFAEPHHDTTGIETVLVNGTVIIDEGREVALEAGSLPGRPLKYQQEC